MLSALSGTLLYMDSLSLALAAPPPWETGVLCRYRLSRLGILDLRRGRCLARGACWPHVPEGSVPLLSVDLGCFEVDIKIVVVVVVCKVRVRVGRLRNAIGVGVLGPGNTAAGRVSVERLCCPGTSPLAAALADSAQGPVGAVDVGVAKYRVVGLRVRTRQGVVTKILVRFWCLDPSRAFSAAFG